MARNCKPLLLARKQIRLQFVFKFAISGVGV
jgi:hypothetical protein